MKVSVRESDVVGTALRAVRNGAPLMLRLWYFVARSASAPYHLSHWVARRWRFIADARDARPYHLSHWVARRLQYVANVEVLPISNVSNIQLAIGHWNWILATMATFLRPAPRHPPRSAPSRPVHLARRPASRRKKCGIMSRAKSRTPKLLNLETIKPT